MNIDSQPVITSRQISKMAHVPHRIVLAEAAEALICAGHNLNDFWHSHINKNGALKKELYLPRMECLIAISGDFYSNNFRAMVLDMFTIEDYEEFDVELPSNSGTGGKIEGATSGTKNKDTGNIKEAAP